MGRLFWKFFFFIWLAQLATIFGLAIIFSLEHQQEHRWRVEQTQGGTPLRNGPPPPFLPPPHPAGEQPAPLAGPPPPPNGGPHPPLPWIPLAVSTLASLVFATLLAWYFAKPIRQLRRALASAATGNLETRLASAMQRNDELSDLGREFDRMASQLQSLMEGQRRLLHDVSHELRSPLARLQAAIGLIRQQPEKKAVYIERIEREGARINRLVGELLTLSRLEAGVTGKMDEEIAIDELLLDLVEDARFEAESLDRQIHFQSQTGTLLSGNGELLHRAVENILRNALRHTPEGTAVDIRALRREDPDRIEIIVADHGPGVPEPLLNKIFEPFFRTNTGASSEGHGLGLAIAKHVATAHGGTIVAENLACGGLQVTLSLPTERQTTAL